PSEARAKNGYASTPEGATMDFGVLGTGRVGRTEATVAPVHSVTMGARSAGGEAAVRPARSPSPVPAARRGPHGRCQSPSTSPGIPTDALRVQRRQPRGAGPAEAP